MNISYEQYLKTSSGQNALKKGSIAAAAGQPRKNNPWPSNCPLRHRAWNEGWDRATGSNNPVIHIQVSGASGGSSKPGHQNKETEMSNQLYETKDGKFVTRLATNSLGHAVVEEKGTGSVFAVDAADLKKVVPYTIELTSIQGGPQHFLAKEGQVKQGDILISPSGVVCVVTQVNSENAHTQRTLEEKNFRRVMTEAL